jgi:anti-sigma factor RsiW
MSDVTTRDIRPHHEAEELLPWYVTGQLNGEDKALVEDHVSSCAHCRRQLAFERRIIDEYAGLVPEVDTGWERLRQRLEPRQPVAPRVSLWDRVAREASAAWQGFTRPAVAALATAQVAFVAIVGTFLYTLSQPSYQALNSAPPPQAANVIAMFRADTTESQMNALLRTNGASVVGGPTSTDAFLLRVPAASREAALAHLRADRHVLMAEPIDGAKS